LLVYGLERIASRDQQFRLSEWQHQNADKRPACIADDQKTAQFDPTAPIVVIGPAFAYAGRVHEGRIAFDNLSMKGSVMIRRRLDSPSGNQPEAVPSPERIAEMTSEIRKGWSPRQKRRRAGLARAFHIMQMPLVPRRKGFWDDYLLS